MTKNKIDLVDKLLQASIEPPTGTHYIERLDITFEIRALTSKQFSRIKRMNTDKKDKLNMEKLVADVVLAGTTNFNWGDERILNAHQLSSGVEAINRLLLAGEIQKLADSILTLSGFNQSEEEVEEEIETIKN